MKDYDFEAMAQETGLRPVGPDLVPSHEPAKGKDYDFEAMASEIGLAPPRIETGFQPDLMGPEGVRILPEDQGFAAGEHFGRVMGGEELAMQAPQETGPDIASAMTGALGVPGAFARGIFPGATNAVGEVVETAGNIPSSAVNFGAGLAGMAGRFGKTGVEAIGQNLGLLPNTGFAAEQLAQEIQARSEELAGMADQVWAVPAGFMEPLIRQVAPEVAANMAAMGWTGEKFYDSLHRDPLGTLVFFLPALEGVRTMGMQAREGGLLPKPPGPPAARGAPMPYADVAQLRESLGLHPDTGEPYPGTFSATRGVGPEGIVPAPPLPPEIAAAQAALTTEGPAVAPGRAPAGSAPRPLADELGTRGAVPAPGSVAPPPPELIPELEPRPPEPSPLGGYRKQMEERRAVEEWEQTRRAATDRSLSAVRELVTDGDAALAAGKLTEARSFARQARVFLGQLEESIGTTPEATERRHAIDLAELTPLDKRIAEAITAREAPAAEAARTADKIGRLGRPGQEVPLGGLMAGELADAVKQGYVRFDADNGRYVRTEKAPPVTPIPSTGEIGRNQEVSPAPENEAGTLYAEEKRLYEAAKPGERVDQPFIQNSDFEAARKTAATLNPGDVIVDVGGDRWVVEQGGLVMPLLENGELGASVVGRAFRLDRRSDGHPRIDEPDNEALNMIARGRILRGEGARALGIDQKVATKVRAKKERPTPAPTMNAGDLVSLHGRKMWVHDVKTSEDGSVAYVLNPKRRRTGGQGFETVPAAEVKPWSRKVRAVEPRIEEAGPEDPGADLRGFSLWVRSVGGVWDATPAGGMSGEAKQLNENFGSRAPNGVVGLLRRDGLSLDGLAEKMQERWPGRFRDYDEAGKFIQEWITGGTRAEDLGPRSRPLGERVRALKTKQVEEAVTQADESARAIGLRISRERVEAAIREGKGVENFGMDDLKPGDVLFLPDEGDVFRVVENKDAPFNEWDVKLQDRIEIKPTVDQPGIDAVRLKAKRPERVFPVEHPGKVRAIGKGEAPAPREFRVAPSRMVGQKGGPDSFAVEENLAGEWKPLRVFTDPEKANAFIETERSKPPLGVTPKPAEVALPGLEGTAAATTEGERVAAEGVAREAADAARIEAEVAAGQGNLFDTRGAEETARRRAEAETEAAGRAEQGGLFEFPAKTAAVRTAEQRPVTMTERGTPPPGSATRPTAVIRRASMVKDLENMMRAPFRIGVGRKRAEGFFNIYRRIVRARNPGDLPTIGHEFGHAIKELLFPEIPPVGGFDYSGIDKKEIHAELQDLGKSLYGTRRPEGGYKNEGFAEFVRLWMFDRPEARKAAPKFSAEWERRLQLDEDSMNFALGLDHVGRDYETYKKQPSVAKILGHISIGERPRRRMTLGRLYAQFLDTIDPIRLAVRAMNGGEMPEHGIDNPYTQAWLYRGWQGPAELVVEKGGGIPDMRTNRFLGLIRRQQLEDPDVIAGTKPMYPMTRKGMTSLQRIVSSKLEQFAGDGLLDIKKGADGKNWFWLNDVGRAELKKYTFQKLYDSLADILIRNKVVDLPLPFVNEVAERLKDPKQKLLSKLPAKWADADAHRGMDAMRVYMVAKHAEEIHAYNARRAADATARGDRPPRVIETGISRSDAVQAVKDLEAMSPGLKQAMSDIQTWRGHLLDLMVWEGVLDPRAAKVMQERWKWYAPFHRFFEDSPFYGGGGGGAGGRGFAGAGVPVRRLGGSYRQIVDPIESLVADSFAIIQRVKQHQVMRAIVESAEEHPGSGWLVERVQKELRPVTLKVGDVMDQLQRIFQDSGVDWEELWGTGKDPALDPNAVLMAFRPTDYAAGHKGVIPYLENGKVRLLQLDPEIYRAVAGLDYENASFALKVLGAPARWTRAGATLTPEFFVRNMMRDAMSGAALSETGGMNPFGGFRPGLDTVRGFSSMMARDDHWFRWKASGGAHATVVSMDRNYLQNSIRRLFNSASFHDAVKNGLWHPIEVLRALGEAGESGTRVAVFRRVLEEYGLDQDTVLRAAIKSRDATIDFNRRGYLMEVPSRMIPFFNAGLQGVDKFGRVTLNVGKGVREAVGGKLGPHTVDAARFAGKIGTYVILPSIATYAMWKSQTPEKYAEYKDASDWQKDLFWMIPLPGKGNYALIPKPFELAVLYGSGTERAMASAFDGRDDEAIRAWSKNLANAFMPNIFPSFLLPTVENFGNRSLYFGRPIEPERERRMQAEARWGPQTSETAKVLAAGMRHAPPGTRALVGGVAHLGTAEDISPRQVDNLIYAWTAGLGSYYAVPALDAVVGRTLGRTQMGKDLGVGAKTKQPLRARDLPVIRAFVSKPEHGRQGLLDRVYNDIQKSDQAYATWRELKPEQAARKLEDPDQRRLIVGYHEFAQAKKALSAFNTRMKEAYEAGDRNLQADVQSKLVEIADQTYSRVDGVLADPTATKAVWLDKALHDMRSGKNADRAIVATTIEEALENGKRREVAELIHAMRPEDRSWAIDYAKKYNTQLKGTEEQQRIRGVPRRIRGKVRTLARTYEETASESQ